MINNQITIVVDAMGGDNAPLKTIKGVEIFLSKNINTKIILLGDKNIITKNLSKKNQLSNIEIIHTLDTVLEDDTASTIIRHRTNSSIGQGLDVIKNIKNSGFVSAGNTAALMILSRLKLGMIEGIDRPAICSVIPNKKDFSIMLDLGANVSVDAKNLLQFAVMGFCYHSILKPNKKPSIGLINIGTEDNKGLEFLREASELIQSSFLKDYFLGFIEPNKIASSECDIMISDGYTGNIMLKTAEGMSQFITNNLKEVFLKSFKNKFAFKILENDLKIFRDKINPDKYNGATFIGVNGTSFKSHGSASPYAFSCAIQNCFDFVKNKVNENIRENFKNI